MLEAGRAFALVTLIADQGSTPRAAGAEMLVRGDGSIAGSIGGGLLEHSMMQAAAAALAERRSRRERGRTSSGTDVRSADKMVCGGAADVLITFVPPRRRRAARGVRAPCGRRATQGAAPGT